MPIERPRPRAGPLLNCNCRKLRHVRPKDESPVLRTNHLASVVRGSLASGRSGFPECAGEVRASELARQMPLNTLCRSKTTGDKCRFDVERSWTGLLEGASERTAPKSLRRAVQDRRVPSCRQTGQHSSRWATPSPRRRAWLSDCCEGGLAEWAPQRGATTLEGVPDEDASSLSSSRFEVATTPLVTGSRMDLSALAT
jgi:hypothetical protein